MTVTFPDEAVPAPEPRCRHCGALIEPAPGVPSLVAGRETMRHKRNGMVGSTYPYPHNATRRD